MNHTQRLRKRVVFSLCLPLIFLYALIMLPLMGLAYAYRSITLRWKLRRTWPAERWILVSYTQSAVWAPCIENQVIPQLGRACIAIDRSQPDWKKRHPAEARAIEHWGGYYEHNPLVLLLPRWRPAQTVRLYNAFRDAKHGKPKALNVELDRLYTLVERYNPTRR